MNPTHPDHAGNSDELNTDATKNVATHVISAENILADETVIFNTDQSGPEHPNAENSSVSKDEPATELIMDKAISSSTVPAGETVNSDTPVQKHFHPENSVEDNATEIMIENAMVTEASIISEMNENEMEPGNVPVPVDSIEMSEEEKEFEEVEEIPDLSSLNKQQLLDTVLKAVKEKEVVEATHIIKAVKPLLDQILEEEQNQALQKFIEEGGSKDDFEFKGDHSREIYNNAVKELKQKKSDEKSRQESEKLVNLKKKELILDQIKELTETEETKDSLKKLKELQTEWKNVRNVPKDKVEQLWENYHVLVHKFYDRLSMFNELKDLDRRKNLDHKIELTKKVTELALEPNIKKALIMLKKYQEEWRIIGPVPAESNEDIWNRFKQECDKIFEMIKAFQVEAEKKREENLEAKKELLAKALELSNFHTTRIKEWLEKSTVANQLMEDWKKAGMVPMKFRESLWDEFKNARNTFFTNKNTFFKALHAEREKNLKIKTELCEKAEAISNNVIDLNRQTDEIKKLQDDWKKSGPVHEKISDAIWKRFRSACDAFFAKKASHYAGQIEEQKNNLEIKNNLIQKLEALLEKEEGADILPELKAIQDEWNNTGFVPINAKEAVSKKYSATNDKVFQKFRQANNELRELKEKSHLEAMMSSPNGMMKVKREEKFIQDKIKGLRSDMETWDNNLGFFARVKGDNPMVEQIKDKISGAQKQIAQLEDKLKQMRKFIKEQQQTA